MKYWQLALLTTLMTLGFLACDDQSTDTQLNEKVSLSIVDESAKEIAKIELVATEATNVGDKVEVEIAKLAAPDNTLNAYFCDLESATDGFRSSSKGDRCPPMPCTALKAMTYQNQKVSYDETIWNQAWSAIDAESHKIFGCYKIQGLGKIHVCKTTDACKASK